MHVPSSLRCAGLTKHATFPSPKSFFWTCNEIWRCALIITLVVHPSPSRKYHRVGGWVLPRIPQHCHFADYWYKTRWVLHTIFTHNLLNIRIHGLFGNFSMMGPILSGGINFLPVGCGGSQANMITVVRTIGHSTSTAAPNLRRVCYHDWNGVFRVVGILKCQGSCCVSWTRCC